MLEVATDVTADTLGLVVSSFQCRGHYREGTPYGSGHINDTYRIVCEADGREIPYILQRVNHNVFKDVPRLMENIGRVTRHLRRKQAGEAEGLDQRILTIVPAKDGCDFIEDSAGGFWRVYVFVEGTISVDVVETPAEAFEAAKAFGEFQSQLADLPKRLHETIPDFHHTRSRFNALMDAIKADPCDRARNVKAEIAFAMAREDMVDVVVDLLAAGDLPERVTHNDTKLNNVLLDAVTGDGRCVIDLDTVMPGSALYDFGDMVRSATTRAPEDEADLSAVSMDITLFDALVRGYLASASGFLTGLEKELLPMSGRLISFEIGLRFLTDYLQGDAYFKTHREGQNIDRCRKQFKMVESMEEQMDAMQRIVEQAR